MSAKTALNTAGAVAFVLLAMWAGFVNIGLPPVVIVGGSGLVALVIWRRTYLRSPSDPSVILPVFLLTVAALDVHMLMTRKKPCASIPKSWAS